MGQTCCAADQTKGTSDGNIPNMNEVARGSRKLESVTASVHTESFSTDHTRDRSDTYG